MRLKSASVTGKLRLGENASIGPTGRTRHSADASDPPCLLHPGAGVRGVKAAVRPRLGDRLPVTAGGVASVGVKLQPPDGDGRAGVPANGSGWSVSWTMHITPHVQSEVDEWFRAVPRILF